MKFTSAFTTTLVVTIATTTVCSGAESNYGIPEWLPQCFDGSSTPIAMVTCVADNMDSECFNENTIQGEIQICLQEQLDGIVSSDEISSTPAGQIGDNADGSTLQAITDAVEYCLGGYTDCIATNIQGLVDSLEPCVNQTAYALGVCAAANAEVCATSCASVLDSVEGTFDDINAAALVTCNGIQNEIMDPSCEIISCCEPCVDEYEALMNCVVNDVLDYTINDCDLSCDARRLTRGLEEGDTTSVGSIASDCLETTPGLTGSDASELADRAAIFLECVSAEYLAIMESDGSATTSSPTAAPTTAPTAGSDAPTLRSWGVGLAFAGVIAFSQFLM